MTLTPPNTASENATESASEPSTPEPTASGSKSSAVPSFQFPFSPEAYAPANKKEKPWHQRGDTSGHDKRPGPAPRGTRRSMGKR
ncbi:hypothetical protein [Pseudomonas sp. Marseille-QA0892]